MAYRFVVSEVNIAVEYCRVSIPHANRCPVLVQEISGEDANLEVRRHIEKVLHVLPGLTSNNYYSI